MFKKLCFAFLFFSVCSSTTVRAQDPMIGEIRMFAGTFAPTGWAFCDGQIMSIAQHASLYSVIGTTYGGNGTATFALPDLRGRAPIHQGSGPGLSNYQLGQKAGQEQTKLVASNLPAVVSTLPVVPMEVNGTVVSITRGTKSLISAGNAGTATIPSNPVGTAVPVNNMQPYLAVNFIIATVGLYPTRN